jgi:hypothetical protein
MTQAYEQGSNLARQALLYKKAKCRKCAENFLFADILLWVTVTKISQADSDLFEIFRALGSN